MDYMILRSCDKQHLLEQLAALEKKGYIGYVSCLNAWEYELRYWLA